MTSPNCPKPVTKLLTQQKPNLSSKYGKCAGTPMSYTTRSHWRLAVKAGIEACEEKREEQWEESRERRRLRATSEPIEPRLHFICNNCNRACRSKIGPYSHSRRCTSLLTELWPCYLFFQGQTDANL